MYQVLFEESVLVENYINMKYHRSTLRGISNKSVREGKGIRKYFKFLP